jgi:hypothetical protein
VVCCCCAGEYDGLLSKDATSSLRSSPAMTIGTGAREGRTSHAKSLSISRSIQHGIDWHVPVIIQVRGGHNPAASAIH